MATLINTRNIVVHLRSLITRERRYLGFFLLQNLAEANKTC